MKKILKDLLWLIAILFIIVVIATSCKKTDKSIIIYPVKNYKTDTAKVYVTIDTTGYLCKCQ